MKLLLSLSLLALFFVGCATDRPTGKSEAEVLLKEAKELIADSRFLMANEKLNTLRSEHPYSFYATHAELLQADILYAQESYVEAAGAYILFKDFHPKHKDLAYVYLRIADSYFMQLPSSYDRDLTAGLEAMKYYNDLLQRYPGTKYVKDAKKRIEKCQKMIENKEKYIADFYFKTGAYDAAQYRYLDILKNFTDSALRSYSMIRVVESSMRMSNYDDCVKYHTKFKGEITEQESIKELESVYHECKKKGHL